MSPIRISDDPVHAPRPIYQIIAYVRDRAYRTHDVYGCTNYPSCAGCQLIDVAKVLERGEHKR